MKYLDVLILLIPSIIIFVTVYLLFKQFFDNQLRIKLADQNHEKKSGNITFKINAYERLLLFCERITLPNLILRLKTNNMNVKELKVAMLLAIQQEYEHNVTQQLYVSDKLWKIVQLAKNQMIEIISQIEEGVSDKQDVNDYVRQLLSFYEKGEKNPAETAKLAIKQEAGAYL